MRARLLSIAATTLAFCAAAPAFAQEVQPFTNADAEGVHVPLLDGEVVPNVSGRVEIAPIAPVSVKVTASNGTSSNASASASYLRMAGRVSLTENLSIFASGFYSVTSFTKSAALSPLANAQPTYLNSGDGVFGARFQSGSDTMRYGGEAGAGVGGGSKGDFSLDIKAISPFARGLFAWAPSGADGPRVSGSLGASYDQSWSIWNSTWADQKTKKLVGRQQNDIHPDERLMLGVYGKGGSVVRVIGGVHAAFPVGPVAKPFAELSFEQTGGTLGVRLTPGVVITPSPRAPRILIGVDIAPIQHGASDAAPAEPLATARIALSMPFGSKGTAGRTGGGTPRIKPGQLRVTVRTPRGSPVQGVSIAVKEPNQKDRILSGTTGSKGQVTLNDVPPRLASVHAVGQGFGIPATPNPGEVDLVFIPLADCVHVQTELVDAGGAHVMDAHATLLQKGAIIAEKPVSGGVLSTDFPGTADMDWRLTISGAGPAPMEIPLETGKEVKLARKLYLDPSKREWRTEAPREIPNLFDPDLADLKYANNAELELARTLLAGPSGAKIVVSIKPGSDKQLTDLIEKARRDALVAWLKSKGIADADARVSTTRGEDKVYLVP